jgi:hypothetical protein
LSQPQKILACWSPSQEFWSPIRQGSISPVRASSSALTV